MPELPDVETWRRYVDATSLHQKIAGSDVNAPRMLQGVSRRILLSRLAGSELESTARHGKYLFVRIESGPWLLLHFGMTSRLSYVKDLDQVPAHTRFLIHFINGYHLACIWQRRLGRIGLVDDPACFIREEGLGPDVYDPGIKLAEFKEMLRNRRGSVKLALMDQGFLAGIGNIYSDEILFQARLHPNIKCQCLDNRELAALHRAIAHVLRLAIAREADPENLPRSWLLANRHKNGECPRCGAPLADIAVGGRTAYYCPSCQRERQ
jgi:formamidopyrimidine-DNA glycosylase